jgi:hypothetical protein
VFDEHVLCFLRGNAAKYEVVSQQPRSRHFKTKCDLSRAGSTRSRQPPGSLLLSFHTNAAAGIKQRQTPEQLLGSHLISHTSRLHSASTAFCHQTFLLVP